MHLFGYRLALRNGKFGRARFCGRPLEPTLQPLVPLPHQGSENDPITPLHTSLPVWGWQRKETRSPVGEGLLTGGGGRGMFPALWEQGLAIPTGAPAADGPRPLCPWSALLQGQMSPRGRGQGSGGRRWTSTHPQEGPGGAGWGDGRATGRGSGPGVELM